MISLNDIQVGTKITKEFDGEIFTGEVVEHFATENLYHAVVYTDGDQEDLSSQEVVECSNLFRTQHPSSTPTSSTGSAQSTVQNIPADLVQQSLGREPMQLVWIF